MNQSSRKKRSECFLCISATDSLFWKNVWYFVFSWQKPLCLETLRTHSPSAVVLPAQLCGGFTQPCSWTGLLRGTELLNLKERSHAAILRLSLSCVSMGRGYENWGWSFSHSLPYPCQFNLLFLQLILCEQFPFTLWKHILYEQLAQELPEWEDSPS